MAGSTTNAVSAINIFRLAGVAFRRNPGTMVLRSSYSLAANVAASTAVFVSLILVIRVRPYLPISRGQIGATRKPAPSLFRLCKVDRAGQNVDLSQTLSEEPRAAGYKQDKG
jgi:hypothetical protein